MRPPDWARCSCRRPPTLPAPPVALGLMATVGALGTFADDVTVFRREAASGLNRWACEAGRVGGAWALLPLW